MRTDVVVRQTDSPPARPGARAFTLIELLVVVAIIALLVSILIPSLTQAKDMARMVLCQSNLHHIALAYVFYTEDYNSYVPPSYSYSENFTWARLISEYAKGTKSDPAVGSFFSGQPPPQEHTLFHCPSEPLHGGQVLRDGYDAIVYGNIREDFAPNIMRCGREGSYNIGAWTKIDSLTLTGGGAMDAYAVEQEYWGTHSETFMLGEANYMDLEPVHCYKENQFGLMYRHLKGGAADMVFFDGHVAPWRDLPPDNGYDDPSPPQYVNNMPYEEPW